MAQETAIEWTNSTWNPVTGCTKLSAGCDHCYAERFSERFRGVAGHPYEHGFDLILRPNRIDQPKTWQTPRMIFVNSMSDLFHESVPKDYISQVFETMEGANRHIYQVLTKRSSLMRNFINQTYKTNPVPPHIWLGVSIENYSTLGRLKHLKQTNASVRFISFEPLLGKIEKVDLSDIHWVIAGGESGPKARPVHVDWLRSLRDQCDKQKVKFFFKQWGGRTPKIGGNILDGVKRLDFPDVEGLKTITEPMRAAGAPTSENDNAMEVEQWAKVKLKCLQKYLRTYTTILSKQRKFSNCWYVDAFAGPGTLRVRKNRQNDRVPAFLKELSPVSDSKNTEEFNELINGSPRNALEISPPFTDYLFIDNDKKHIRHLNQLKKHYESKSVRIAVEEGDCGQILRNWMSGKRWKNLRGVVFLDPFGMQVEWEIIEKIATTKALEIILNFPVGMAIQRLLKNSGEFSDSERRKLSNYFGTEEWYEVLYSTQLDLVGEHKQKVEESGEVLLNWYQKRLKSVFKCVSAPRAIYNTSNKLLYYLIFAGHNETGLKIASDLLKQGQILRSKIPPENNQQLPLNLS